MTLDAAFHLCCTQPFCSAALGARAGPRELRTRLLGELDPSSSCVKCAMERGETSCSILPLVFKRHPFKDGESLRCSHAVSLEDDCSAAVKVKASPASPPAALEGSGLRSEVHGPSCAGEATLTHKIALAPGGPSAASTPMATWLLWD